MLLVLNSYLWKSEGCITLLAGAWYALDKRAYIFNYIYSRLKYVFAIPPAASQQSTWPGEANWPLDDDNEVPQPEGKSTGIG